MTLLFSLVASLKKNGYCERSEAIQKAAEQAHPAKLPRRRLYASSQER